MSRRKARYCSRRRPSGRRNWLQAVFQVLSVLALVLMPLNMAANAQVQTASWRAVAHAGDCDMGSKHQPDSAADTSLCVIACTALPAPREAILQRLALTPAVPLTRLPTVVLDGADLEPVPPPPRTA